MSQHILIIEDDSRLAAMVAQYLQQSGYTVSCAGDGASGLSQVSAPAPGQ
ncbi:MAG: response regulator transcription factor, partial [Ferruginibacter sp.]|nr:response regulator transcription factor [Rhodoferax sp.]